MSEFTAKRGAMVETVRKREDLSESTVAAMRAVPRHEFVPRSKRDVAYQDRPLPIGEGQTISAPHMVAIMTELLDLEPGMAVLEIGTGCGYHAAVTAEVVGPAHVASVEYHDDLADRARTNLAQTGYEKVSVRSGDGKQGWPAQAPFDRAYLTCAAERFPRAVVEQVREGGLLLGPLENHRQELVRAHKEPDGSLARSEHGAVRFVPLR